MSDINEVKFSGTIDRLKRVNTKTGTSMATLFLTVRKDKFKCVGFKNVADTLLTCKDGDHILVNGSGSINSWKDDDGHWHNDFQVTAWAVEIDGKNISYDEGKSSGDQPPLPPGPSSFDRDQFAYQGGPF